MKRGHVATAVLLTLVLCNCRRTRTATVFELFATRDGPTILLHPSNVTFHVPQQWIKSNDEFHNNFHLSRAELESVRDGSGEWDTEYAEVVNAALPFQYCAVHAGGEGWGKQGVSFADVQMRAYDTPFSKQDVMTRIRGSAFDAVRRISSKSNLAEASQGQWQSAVIDYFLWYGDYGGTARIRFYVQSTRDRTLVLVFMGGNDQEVQEIIQSVSIPHT